ncbi:MAG TPA: alpha-L-rhamnosidase C-terminal domain-containing protein, partial [Chthonomonadales bacterium]|nr:alpha-L-rhamnosidase C-terminal domain-containing protein [Chthonomonadales bacterium]
NAMSMAGHTRAAMGIVRKYWGGMIAEGATTFWEGYDPSWPTADFHAHLQADNGTGYFVSLCHGWSSGATSWLTEQVLGIRPTGGGFRTADIVPRLGDLEWAEGAVPAPHGQIVLSVRKEGSGMVLQLTLPQGVAATVGVPGSSVILNGKPAQIDNRQEGRAYFELTRPGRYTIQSST